MGFGIIRLIASAYELMSRSRYEADGLRRSSRETQPAQSSKGRRHEVVDDREHDQKDEPDPEAKTDELLLDRQQRLGRSFFKLGADIGLRHGLCSSQRSAGQRR